MFAGVWCLVVVVVDFFGWYSGDDGAVAAGAHEDGACGGDGSASHAYSCVDLSSGCDGGAVADDDFAGGVGSGALFGGADFVGRGDDHDAWADADAFSDVDAAAGVCIEAFVDVGVAAYVDVGVGESAVGADSVGVDVHACFVEHDAA